MSDQTDGFTIQGRKTLRPQIGEAVHAAVAGVENLQLRLQCRRGSPQVESQDFVRCIIATRSRLEPGLAPGNSPGFDVWKPI